MLLCKLKSSLSHLLLLLLLWSLSLLLLYSSITPQAKRAFLGYLQTHTHTGRSTSLARQNGQIFHVTHTHQIIRNEIFFARLFLLILSSFWLYFFLIFCVVFCCCCYPCLVRTPIGAAHTTYPERMGFMNYISINFLSISLIYFRWLVSNTHAHTHTQRWTTN